MILSSAEPITGNDFSGYAWVGSDLIVGSQGARAYENETGSGVPLGEDGCYATVQQTSNGWEIGTDYRGLSRLFLYRSGRNWAIGTSLYGIVKYVRNRGWALTPLEDSLRAFFNRGGFSTQLSSLDAHFEQIQLVPSFTTVRVSSLGVTLKVREPQHALDYRSALSNFINIWKARLSTLSHAEGSHIRFDLSGGIDSRTVIAFALENGKILEDTRKSGVVSSTSPAMATDLRVAESLASKYGFELNQASNRGSQGYDADLAIDGWRHHSLGVYSPVYLYGSEITPAFVHAHGAGGGNFRPTYKSIESKIRALKKNLTQDDYDLWRNRIQESVELLLGWSSCESKELLHYREFRNRFHFGHRPHQNLVFMPLESKFTDPITDRSDGRDPRQIYFDIMQTLVPGLMQMPYDTEEKSPTRQNLRELTQVTPKDLGKGTVYWLQGQRTNDGTARSQAFDRWICDASMLLSQEHVASRLPSAMLASAKSAIDSWKKNRTRPSSNALGMIGLSHSYAIDFLTNERSVI